MSETLEELLDEDMGDVVDMGLELDLDEDALLADDNDENVQNSKENKTMEDEDFIEIGIEDDISDDLKNDVGDDKKATADENERNKERSRFKTERNITSVPRNNSIPETLDAVPVKTNYTQNNQRGKRTFRGGPRGRHRGGMNGPQHFPYPQQQPPYQPAPQFSSGNIHVNPHFRNNFNIPGGGMWNNGSGWSQDHPRPMLQQPNYNDQSWGRYDNQPVDHQYQHHQDQDYYNGSNHHNYQNNFQPPHPAPGWEQQFYQQDEYHQPYQHIDQQYRPMGNNVHNFYPQPPPQNFHGNMPPPFNSPPRNKFRGGIHRGAPKPGVLSVKNKGQIRDNYMQNKAVLKQQRFDALRKVTISNLHEVEMVHDSPEKKPKINNTPVEEDEEMRAYRLKIEEQKKLREELLRQKEEKRKVTAQQKSQLLEAERKKGTSSEVESDQSEFKVVRVRTPDGKTVLKKLTISQISKLKKVNPSNNANNGVEPKADIVSKIVAIDNLSASTTKKQLETMAKQTGTFESITLDAEAKKAVIKFTTEESALNFKNRNQHKMVDLSMISVRLIPEDQ